MTTPKSKHMRVELWGDEARVSYRPDDAVTFGSANRVNEILRDIKRLLKRRGWMSITSDGAIAARIPDVAKLLAEFLRDADKAIDKIAARQLHPREVEALLSITARERIRWTKDGRLPTSGRGSFRRGQMIEFSTYSPKAMMELADSPGKVASWRASDRMSDAGEPR